MANGKIIVYGGNGALGREVVSFFKGKNFWVGSIDLSSSDSADASVVVTALTDWQEQQKDIHHKVSDILGEDKVDAIFCVAGGWAGGNASSADFVKNADMMWKQSVWSSTIASSLAAKHLNQGGVLTLSGAAPSLSGTAGMMGYGMAKAAVHQLTKSLAGKNSGLPENSFVAATLPVTLDTPMNRKFMASADMSKWTPLSVIAEKFHDWCSNQNGRPESGSLIHITTADGKTNFDIESSLIH